MYTYILYVLFYKGVNIMTHLYHAIDKMSTNILGTIFIYSYYNIFTQQRVL